MLVNAPFQAPVSISAWKNLRTCKRDWGNHGTFSPDESLKRQKERTQQRRETAQDVNKDTEQDGNQTLVWVGRRCAKEANTAVALYHLKNFCSQLGGLRNLNYKFRGYLRVIRRRKFPNVLCNSNTGINIVAHCSIIISSFLCSWYR